MSVLNPLTRRVALDARQKSEALLQCSLVVSPARALFVEFVQQSRMPTQFLGDQLLVCICFSFSRLDCSSGFSCCRLSVLPRVFTLQHSGHGERAGRPSAWRTMARHQRTQTRVQNSALPAVPSSIGDRILRPDLK